MALLSAWVALFVPCSSDDPSGFCSSSPIVTVLSSYLELEPQMWHVPLINENCQEMQGQHKALEPALCPRPV